VLIPRSRIVVAGVAFAQMSAMLSSFINLNSKYNPRRKRKKNNLNIAIRRIQSPPASPASFMSPEIVDINEKVFAPLGRTHSPHPQDEEESYDSYVSRHDENALPRSIPQTSSQLNVDTYSEPVTDWFTHESLKTAVREALAGNYDGLNGSGSLISSGRGVGTARSNRSREAFAPSEEAASQSDEVVLTYDPPSYTAR
jgi:hypothetical protein